MLGTVLVVLGSATLASSVGLPAGCSPTGESCQGPLGEVVSLLCFGVGVLALGLGMVIAGHSFLDPLDRPVRAARGPN